MASLQNTPTNFIPKSKRRNLSRLFISTKSQIFLIDYGNAEVTMQPLAKTLFLFFLKNPKGIFFYNLPDHRTELLEIYEGITNRYDQEMIEKNIDRLIDLRENSIHEKCSRIKEAFRQHLPHRFLNHYTVMGARKDKKRIKLKPELIIWEQN